MLTTIVQELERIPPMLSDILKLRIKMDTTLESLRGKKDADSQKLLG